MLEGAAHPNICSNISNTVRVGAAHRNIQKTRKYSGALHLHEHRYTIYYKYFAGPAAFSVRKVEQIGSGRWGQEEIYFYGVASISPQTSPTSSPKHLFPFWGIVFHFGVRQVPHRETVGRRWYRCRAIVLLYRQRNYAARRGRFPTIRRSVWCCLCEIRLHSKGDDWAHGIGLLVGYGFLWCRYRALRLWREPGCWVLSWYLRDIFLSAELWVMS